MTPTTFATGSAIASKIDMQNRLFAELSAMFGSKTQSAIEATLGKLKDAAEADAVTGPGA